MSDDDLIRRGDALNACRASEHRYEAHDAIDALPAVTQPAPDAAADRIEELEVKLAKAVDALLWCSGSPDFNEGGMARKGWLKVCAPIILAELTGGKDE